MTTDLRRLSSSSAAALAVALLVPFAAGAQTSALADAKTERLPLSPGAEGSLLFGGGRLLPVGPPRLSALVHYQNGALLLRPAGGSDSGARFDHRATAVVSAAWAPMPWMQLNAEVPVIGYQLAAGLPAGSSAPPSSGLGAPTLGVRFGVLREADPQSFDLSLGLDAALPLGSGGLLGHDERGPVLIPRVGVGRSMDKLRFGGELFAHVRRGIALTSGTQTDVVGREVGLGAFVTYAASDTVRAELNVFGALPLQTTGYSAEVIAGARYQVVPGFELFALGGPGFGELVGTPQFRMLAGAAVTPRPPPPPVQPIAAAAKPLCEPGAPHEVADCPDLDKDADGVPNRADECPGSPEDRDGFLDHDGCLDPDNDKDGLVDARDACPNVPGTLAGNGCAIVDSDGDKLADEQDRCPSEAGSAELKGCPDADADGVANLDDKCPNERGAAARGGCPVKDTDLDGIADSVDNCVAEKGPASNQGCPPNKRQVVTITRDRLLIAGKVEFGSNNARLTPRSNRLLNSVADIVKSRPEIKKLTVEGHTDDVGKPEKNQVLSMRRAEAVRAYLVKRGVPASKIEAQGFGADRPVESNRTRQGREANRRVEFKIETDGG